MSNFSRSRRNYVFVLVLILGFLPGALAFLSTAVNLNPTDPHFFDADYGAQFTAGKGVAGRHPVEVRSEGRRQLVIKEGAREFEFPFSAEGSYVKDGKDTGAYPLYWVRFPAQHKMMRKEVFRRVLQRPQ